MPSITGVLSKSKMKDEGIKNPQVTEVLESNKTNKSDDTWSIRLTYLECKV